MEATTAAEQGTAPPVHGETITQALEHTADRVPDRIAVRTKGGEETVTWSQLRDRADALAAGLRKLGVGKGDSVALMLGNRPEFHVADLAVMTLGATPFSIYQTYAPEQIQYVVSDAEARVAILDAQYLDRFREARKDLPKLERLIVVDEASGDDIAPLAEVEQPDESFDGAAARNAVDPEDMLTLIYTSGTTGPPKGVQVTHHNLMAAVKTIDDIIQFPDGGRVISWLPAAHIAERAAHHYIPMAYGLEITTCPNPREIAGYLPEVRPNWFFAVPRIWEKLKAGLEAMVAAQPDDQRRQAQAALDAATEKVRLEQRGEPVPDELAEKVAKADEAMFAKLREMLGLDQIVAVNVGAAPTPVEVLEFFHAIGIPVGELWGMSETCGAGACNPPDRVKIGTVGPPTPGAEIKLAEDGEVLIRAEFVMPGYRHMPDKTAEAFDEDGFLKTGDIGEFDDDGYLRIVDRKKELIINAAGKNMSPANIEAKLKTASPLIGQCVAIGDRRPFNTALIVLDPDFAPAWAQVIGLGEVPIAELARHEELIAAVQEGVEEANSKLSRVEQIKKFTILEEEVAKANEDLARVEQIKKFKILPTDWTPGGDELTPTMKLKRRPIDRKYA
ncbi:MAG: AMP-dependent synthetase/ligase, partial [Solirubrobacteraceae bacterium]